MYRPIICIECKYDLLVRFAQTYSHVESRDSAKFATHVELSMSNMNGSGLR
jgi:hypothetical protein